MKKIYALVMAVAFAVSVMPAVMAADTAKKAAPAQKTEAVKADDTNAAAPADTQKKKPAKKAKSKKAKKEQTVEAPAAK